MEFNLFGYDWETTDLVTKLTRGDAVEFEVGKSHQSKSFFGSVVCRENFGYGVYEWSFAHPVFEHCVFSAGLGFEDIRLLVASGNMHLYPKLYKKNFLKSSIHPQVWRDGENMTGLCNVSRPFLWNVRTRKPNRYFLIWTGRCVKVFYNSELVMSASDDAVLAELDRCNGRMTPYIKVGYEYSDGEINHMDGLESTRFSLCGFKYTPFDE